MSSAARHEAAPLVARIAGLPADVMEAFSTDLAAGVQSRLDLEEELHEAREQMVERLYDAIHGAPPAPRRALLAVKRDCFNGRPLGKYRDAEVWSRLVDAAGPLAERIVELEEALERARSEFLAAYQEEDDRQCERLRELLADPFFRCGLAMASPLVAKSVRRLTAKPPAAWRRRERRLVPTLARYASRAALKLSPFSTFTPVALAQIHDDPGAAAVELYAGEWQARSLVRLRRHLLDRCSDMLQHHPPWRATLRVEQNDSLHELATGRSLFLRPSGWRLDETPGELRFSEQSLVKAGLGGPLVERLRAILASERPICGELTERLARELDLADSSEVVAHELDVLINAGYLQLLPPWPEEEGHLEKRMLEHLRALDGGPQLAPFVERLTRLVTLEEGLLEAADPAGVISEMESLVDELVEAAAPLAGLDPAGVTRRSTRHDIYQDVWWKPRHGTALVRLRRDAAEKALGSIEPVLRYSRLFDHRHEALATLGAFLAERRGDTGQADFLEAFHDFQPLWQSYMKFQVQTRDSDLWRTTWNPLELDVLNELDRRRQAAAAGFGDCLAETADGQRLDAGALNALLDQVPARFTSVVCGACLFLQPASADGSLWMLNRVKEGTGRFSSRYTPVMDAATRRRYTGALTARGTFELDGERVELLDVLSIQGDTLNVHAPQTPKVLTLPGTHTDLPRERRRTLGDLCVTWAPDGEPHLRDREGQRYLAVHLGIGYQDYMPTLTKFLCSFGPSEMGAVFPRARSRVEHGVTIHGRTCIGNVVLQRKCWAFSLDELRRHTERRDDVEVFEAVNRWRLARGIPERVFAIENVPHPIRGSRTQPQYLDFTAPIFIPVLRSMLEDESGMLTVFEVLPPAAAFPRDAAGRPRAVEVLLDSLALQAPSERVAGLKEAELDPSFPIPRDLADACPPFHSLPPRAGESTTGPERLKGEL